MLDFLCKKRGSLDYVKNGFFKGKQRYKCTDYGCIFTNTLPRSKMCGVRDVTVLKWIRQKAH